MQYQASDIPIPGRLLRGWRGVVPRSPVAMRSRRRMMGSVQRSDVLDRFVPNHVAAKGKVGHYGLVQGVVVFRTLTVHVWLRKGWFFLLMEAAWRDLAAHPRLEINLMVLSISNR